MNIYVAVGIFGIISNFVAALADLPLIKPGKPGENENISLNGVQPWWAEVPTKRFKLSFWLSFWTAGCLCYPVASCRSDCKTKHTTGCSIENQYTHRMLYRSSVPYVFLYETTYISEVEQKNVRQRM